MITFKKVTEADEQLNSQIEELNRKVFPSAETTANLHFPTQEIQVAENQIVTTKR